MRSVSDLDRMTQMSIRDNDDSDVSTGDELPSRQPNHTPVDSAWDEDDDLLGPKPRSAALHRPVSYFQIRQQHMEKIRKAGATGKVQKSNPPGAGGTVLVSG